MFFGGFGGSPMSGGKEIRVQSSNNTFVKDLPAM